MDRQSLNLDQPFDLDLTMQSGQIFHWFPQKKGYIIPSSAKVFQIWQEDHILRWKSLQGKVTPEFIYRFFRLDDDLSAIFADWESDSFIQNIFQEYIGLRILRQDPWECMLGFITSIASNIPRIRKNLLFLAETYGSLVKSDGSDIHLLPTPFQLGMASLDDLYGAGLGFRAKFFDQTIPLLTRGLDLHGLKNLSYQDARKKLTRLHGIGEKVADCILLFSMDYLQAFPVDTWMIKVLKEYYFPKQSANASKLAALSREHFGACGGYAQQYLYHFARKNMR